MALFDDVVGRSNITTGLVVGVGGLIAWPLISPMARPLAKSLIKGGLVAYRQAEQLYAGAVEGIGDMIAEIQQEIGTTTPAHSPSDTGDLRTLEDGQPSNFPRRRSGPGRRITGRSRRLVG